MIPRAIFLAIAIVVIIYLSVGFVTVGAVQQDTGLPNWLYLGENAERAMIETARAIMPYGALIMILGYGIIAVPTGIVSVELAGAVRRGVTTRACPQCGAGGHDGDAEYCKYCGSEL